MSKRLYPHNRLRYWYVYDIDEICATFADCKLHPQTVRKWIKNGLQTIDKSRPVLIYGYDLITFLKEQNSKGKCKTPFDQFFCMKCKDARPVYQNKVTLEQQSGYIKASGCCRECKTRMFKSYKMSDYSALNKTFQQVDVLELYDCTTDTCKTHLAAQEQNALNESLQGRLF